jgi:hypothetical protein
MNLNEQISRIKEVMGLVSEQITSTGYNLPNGHVIPTCTETGCKGTYSGPQFNIIGRNTDGTDKWNDIAHDYSNTMSYYVGVKLKELYKQGIYVKVDLEMIKMTANPVKNEESADPTKVTIDIPFIRVKNKCEAYTSFDHAGGWGHLSIDLDNRKTQLSSALLPGETLDISTLNKTNKTDYKTSLNEYWIQWKNKATQSDCANNSTNVTPQTTSVTPQKTNITPQTTSVTPQKTNVTPQTTSSSSNGEEVKVTGNGIIELRKNIISKSSNASIDVNSIKVNMDKFEISYKSGPTKINKISLFTRNTDDVKDSSGFTTTLDNVISQNKSDNLTVEVIKRGYITNYPFNDGTKKFNTTLYWAVLLII